MIKKIILLFFSIVFHSYGQKKIWILDSLDKKPIYGIKLIENKRVINSSDIEGKILISSSENSLLTLQSLNYKSKTFVFSEIKDTIFLSPITYLVSETTITPTNAKEILLESAHKMIENHAPFSFFQLGTYREEFIEAGKTFKVQEMLFQLHQFQKNSLLETRTFYKLNSNTQLLSCMSAEDSMKKEKLKQIIGKKIASKMNFNELSLYTYIKGTNILNRIFTYLLEPDSKYTVQYRYIASEIIQSEEVLKLEVLHFLKKTLVTTSTIYIAAESKAVVGFEIRAHQNIENISIFDFKTKIILWILGIKIQIKQYYAKVLFEKNNKGFWTVSDVLFEFPAIFNKKETLNGLAKVKYRLQPKIFESKNENTNFSENNRSILQNKNSFSPPFKKLNFSIIPVTEPEKERWNILMKK